MGLHDYHHEHPEIAELRPMVADLTELVGLQAKRIDDLEAQLAECAESDAMYVAQKSADQAMALARGAAVLASGDEREIRLPNRADCRATQRVQAVVARSRRRPSWTPSSAHRPPPVLVGAAMTSYVVEHFRVLRTREGMARASAKGKLKGGKPKLNARQSAHLVELHELGEHSISELAELFGVARPTVYRTIARQAS